MLKTLLASAAMLAVAPAAAQQPAVAATEAVTVIHAGTLLAQPGRAARRNASVIVRGRTIAEVRDGFVEIDRKSVV